MFKELRTALVLVAAMTVLTGLVYPLAVTGLAQLAFPWQANGSLLEKDGRVVGSALIGQQFSGAGYFWGRPSAAGAGYDAQASGGSNLAPSSKAWAETVAARAQALRAAHPGQTAPVPMDLVTASASGLDPHVSPAAAHWQAGRVAASRKLPLDDVTRLINVHTEGRVLGILGEARVNVLALNLALDHAMPTAK